MLINDHTAKERTWAIPAISALMTLHHDFPIPRLAQVCRMAWFDDALVMTLRYGTCNISGNVLESTDFIVTLHSDGAVGVQLKNQTTPASAVAILGFLAGEIVRETRRWAEDLVPWTEGSATLDDDRATVLNIVGALIAYPVESFETVVEKELSRRAVVNKVRIIGETAMMEITSAGIRSANLYVQPLSKHSMTVRSYKKYDIPAPSTWRKPAHTRLINKVSCSTVRLALLPMDFMIYLCDKAQAQPVGNGKFATRAKPTTVIDANAGDDLSALFN